MRRLYQTSYQEPAPSEVANDPLVIHQRKGGPDNKSLVVFVHGLGGKRYGASPTWGNFPRFVFDELPDIDVGVYQYETLVARLKFWRSIALDREAEIFAQIIRDDLDQYQNIILIGHSMGGLLSKAVITALIDTKDLDRISGLFLMATPQLGSTKVPRFLGISSDARALKIHGDFVSRITKTFEDRLYLDETVNAPNRTVIPTWAVLGASDFWVDELSAGVGLPSNRKRLVHGSHTEIVKPKRTSSPAYTFVRERLESCLNRYEYDVFLAAPMAALETEEDYQRYRNGALAVERALAEHCDIHSVFYAGRDLPTKDAFEAAGDSLAEDYAALRKSRHFMLLYPESKMSSVIYEAGMALAMGKPSTYVTNKRNNLPFLMQQAPQAFEQVRVKIYDNCASVDDVVSLIANNGRALFIE